MVILEGEVDEVKDTSVLKLLDQAYKAKYGMAMQGPGCIYKLIARKIFAWSEQDFPTSATRWNFM
ncbi:MAG: hypothetical protein WD740_07090 [Anaerolineales bacterium]